VCPIIGFTSSCRMNDAVNLTRIAQGLTLTMGAVKKKLLEVSAPYEREARFARGPDEASGST
jgi:hypothetical protein